jgi:hypothetical protein
MHGEITCVEHMIRIHSLEILQYVQSLLKLISYVVKNSREFTVILKLQFIINNVR